MERPIICPPLNKVTHTAASYGLAKELDPDASIHLARNLLLDELPGLAYGLVTLIYIVTRLLGLT